ncbi:MAG: imelysin family protein [Pseudomonadota bacterium]
MYRPALAGLLALALPLSALPSAADPGALVDVHVMPGFVSFDAAAAALSEAAQTSCNPEDSALRTAYGAAFDAWIRVSHLRFGPTETQDRGFALAFWPDSRGKTAKALAQMIAQEDAAARSAELFRTVSVAARGFYAFEFLLYDPTYAEMGSDSYRCTLIRAIAADIANNAAAILQDWQAGYAALFATAGANDTYRTTAEANQELFKAVSTGLEFTLTMRLGRPLGTFERPRPNRAEARRSERSLRHIVLSLEATQALALGLADGDAPLTETLERAFTRALDLAAALDDPVLAMVAEPSGRFRVEALQSAVKAAHAAVLGQLGPKLGVAVGFNSLDGD